MWLQSAFLHRLEISDLMGRVGSGNASRSDHQRLDELLTFNRHALPVVLESFASQIFAALFGGEIVSRRIETRDELKDFVCVHPSARGPRIDELIHEHRMQAQQAQHAAGPAVERQGTSLAQRILAPSPVPVPPTGRFSPSH